MKKKPYVSPDFKVVIYESEQDIMTYSTTHPDPFDSFDSFEDLSDDDLDK